MRSERRPNHTTNHTKARTIAPRTSRAGQYEIKVSSRGLSQFLVNKEMGWARMKDERSGLLGVSGPDRDGSKYRKGLL